MRKSLIGLTALAVLTACGGGDANESRADATPSETTSAAPRTPSPKTTRPSAPSATSSAYTMSPEDEAGFVATVTAQTFTENEEVFSTELVKSNGLVEAQTDFRFDQPARTLVLAVTSVFSGSDRNPRLAYDLATDFAPVFWGAEVPDTIRPESLVLFSVTVDDSSFICDGPTMAALADRELSEEMFVQQCAA
jgi:hypothetical protein